MKPRNQIGHSLVELITVLAIIAVLTAVAFVGFGSGDLTVRMKAAAKKLLSDVHYAQNLAISTGAPVQVVISVSENSYSLKWQDGTPVPNIMGGGNFVVDFNNGDFPGVSITATDLAAGTVTFSALGIPSTGGAEIQIQTLVASFNDQLSVKIEPYTGRLTIE